jgi:hypothetical protein
VKRVLNDGERSIAVFMRKLAAENPDITAGEIFNTTVEEFSKCENPDPDLTNVVAQLVEDHIRSVGTRVVFLEQIRPHWWRDGYLQIGSDYQQVFAHVQV